MIDTLTLGKELLRRYDQISEGYELEKLDNIREKAFNRDVQIREQQLQKELRSYKDDMVGKPKAHLLLVRSVAKIYYDVVVCFPTNSA